MKFMHILRKLGNEEELFFFFFLTTIFQKHWLLQRSGLNTTEAIKNMSEWMTHRSGQYGGHTNAICHQKPWTQRFAHMQRVQICIYLTMAAAPVATIWLKQKRKVTQLVNFKLRLPGYCIPSGLILLSNLETQGWSPQVRWEENPRV